MRFFTLTSFAPLLLVIACGGSGSGGDAPRQDAGATDGLSGDGGTSAAEGGEPSPADGAPPTTAFTTLGRAPEPCPLTTALCSSWPSASDGAVFRYTSQETFGGKTFERTFHVFVPNATTTASPVVVVLHGGNGSGARSVASQAWTTLAMAKPAGITWTPNTVDCQALPTTEANGLKMQAPGGGASCTSPSATAVNAQPFIVVYPDGVADAGTKDVRHWEDGRLPSPGTGAMTPSRDDVGFIDHVLDVVLNDKQLPTDPSATYLAGVSNGGIMTQRIAGTAGAVAYPRVMRIAAYAAYVSDLAEPITPAPSVPFGLALFHGTGIVTPDCNSPGCTTPTVLGDERMPFGAAGSSHYVNSPDRGLVHSGPDTIEAWRSALGAKGAGVTDDIGVFTKRTIHLALPAVLHSWVTDGGGHTFASGRNDFLPVPRGWAFVSSFRRDPTGTLTRVQPTWLSGTF